MAHDDLDDLFDSEESESALPKKLRAKIDELSSKLKELSEENASLKAGQRKADLNQILQDNGYSPKIANFMPTDLELTEEEYHKDMWLMGRDYAAIPEHEIKAVVLARQDEHEAAVAVGDVHAADGGCVGGRAVG